jgi:hypothetical protein
LIYGHRLPDPDRILFSLFLSFCGGVEAIPKFQNMKLLPALPFFREKINIFLPSKKRFFANPRVLFVLISLSQLSFRKFQDFLKTEKLQPVFLQFFQNKE